MKYLPGVMLGGDSMSEQELLEIEENNGSTLTDEKLDFLVKEAVRLELEKQKALGIELYEVDPSKMVNVYA